MSLSFRQINQPGKKTQMKLVADWKSTKTMLNRDESFSTHTEQLSMESRSVFSSHTTRAGSQAISLALTSELV